MNWQNLKDLLNTFTEEQLKQDVTIQIDNGDGTYTAHEFYAIDTVAESDDTCDVLDEGHKYFKVVV